MKKEKAVTKCNLKVVSDHVWRRILTTDIVKSPKVTTSNTENSMSQSNKSASESKFQPAEKPKPAPVKSDDFSVDGMLVGDSSEGLRKKGE